MEKSFSAFVLMFVAVTAFPSLSLAESDSRPNIIWIIADDLSPDLGCYGQQLEAVKTPHLEGLAR